MVILWGWVFLVSEVPLQVEEGGVECVESLLAAHDSEIETRTGVPRSTTPPPVGPHSSPMPRGLW